jgi:hypothetical protein
MRPVLIDLNCGSDIKHLRLIYKYERHRYSAFYGFEFTGETIPAAETWCTLFKESVRTDFCENVPWAVFSHQSYDKAEQIVKQHGHPDSYVHLATRTLVEPPRMIKTTKKRKLSPVRSTYNLRKRVRDKK